MIRADAVRPTSHRKPCTARGWWRGSRGRLRISPCRSRRTARGTSTRPCPQFIVTSARISAS